MSVAVALATPRPRLLPPVLAADSLHDPRSDLAKLEADGWRLKYGETQMGTDGETCFSRRIITLRPGLSWRRERCVLQHEVLHAERGPFPHSVVDQEEALVRLLSARRLFSYQELLQILPPDPTDSELLAEQLSIDGSTLFAGVRDMLESGLAPAWFVHLWMTRKKHA